jgi:hypothetical protein
MPALYDKNRRAIAVGDVLKVFHFVGARRKQHFMYKHVTGQIELGANGAPYFEVSHLNLGADDGYDLAIDGKVLQDYEIIQCMTGEPSDRTQF